MLCSIVSLLIANIVLGCLAQVATADAHVCDQGTWQSSLPVADDFVDFFHEGPTADHLSLLQRAVKMERKPQEKTDVLASAKGDSASDSHGDARAKLESLGKLKLDVQSTSSTVELESHGDEKSDAITASKGPVAEGDMNVDEKPKLESHIKNGSDLLAASKGVPQSSKSHQTVIVLSTRVGRTKVKQANHEHLQDDESSSETTTNDCLSRLPNFYGRKANAVWDVLLSIILIPCSISLLWINERRNAQLESVIGLGSKQAETTDPDREGVDEYDGCLVHMDSADAMGIDPVEDKRFSQVKKDSGILRLKSSVQVFQWKEETHEKLWDCLGGGETTKKTYTYKKEWSDEVIDSGKFHQESHKNTVHIKKLKPGIEEQTNKTVKYGKNHYMPTDLVEMLSNWSDADQLVSGSLAFDSQTFKPGSNHYYYCGSGTEHEPEVGDFRVKIEYVPDGPASVLALQTKDKKHTAKRSFGPCRAVSHGWWCCGESEDVLKQRRLEAAKFTGDELYENEKCWDFGCFLRLCHGCNAITWYFTHTSATIPQLYGAWSGKKSKLWCLNAVKWQSLGFRWGFRLAGWFVLWLGLWLLFQALDVFTDIVPFLGPYLGTGIAYITLVLSFLTTLIIAMLIVSCAYMVYNPAMGMIFLFFTTAICIGIYFRFDYKSPSNAATMAATNGTKAHVQHLYWLGWDHP